VVVIALVVGLTGCTARLPGSVSRPTPAGSTSAAPYDGSCLGAAALAAPPGSCPATPTAPLVPALNIAAHDRSDAYPDVSHTADCFGHRPIFPMVICKRGVATGTVRVALVGNSHAAEWLPAIERIASTEHWQITTYLASGCALAEVEESFSPTLGTRTCLAWVDETIAKVTEGSYDLVIMANKISQSAVGANIAGSWQPYETGYARVLDAFHRAHLTVVGIHDSPAPVTVVVPTCLEHNLSDLSACDGTRTQWLPNDPLAAAVAGVHDPQITLLDLSNDICAPTRCAAVVGRVIVYYDNSHLTATYARTLAPYLEPALVAALARHR
jgi:hypothetical protein